MTDSYAQMTPFVPTKNKLYWKKRSKALSSKFYRYYQTKLKTNIKEKVQVPFPIGDLQKMWTNNNSESLNHVLKKAIDWKSQPLLDIVNILTKIIETV